MSNLPIESEISTDPLFRSLAKLARQHNIETPSLQIESGKIYTKAHKYSLVPNYLLDCLMLALEDCPKTTWKIALYVIRHICGDVQNDNGMPTGYISQRIFFDHPIRFQKELVIKGKASYDQAFKNLEKKKIIFFKEERVKPNLFPLTWNIEDEKAREKIKEIVEKEIERVDKKSVGR